MQPPRSGLSERVADRELGRQVDELRVLLPRLHSGVTVCETPYELLVQFREKSLCRVVPYRELLHVQVGQDPVWETRIRSAREWPEVMDRIVRVFLRAVARAEPPRASG
jgi:hypothetical protein